MVERLVCRNTICTDMYSNFSSNLTFYSFSIAVSVASIMYESDSLSGVELNVTPPGGDSDRFTHSQTRGL